MKTVMVIQARMTSTRLPGKVLKQVLGKPLLEIQLERLKKTSGVDEIVVATTTNDTDEPILELCARLGVPTFRGSEQDVLSRYYGAAKQAKADTVIRVTSDCPLIDPLVVGECLNVYKSNRGTFDFVANCLERTYPRGMDTEVFSFEHLKQAHEEAKTEYQREHVTPFFYQQKDRFRIGHVRCPRNLGHCRWTVDTPQDFQLIEKLLTACLPKNPQFTLWDLVEIYERRPELQSINKDVVQKVELR